MKRETASLYGSIFSLSIGFLMLRLLRARLPPLSRTTLILRACDALVVLGVGYALMADDLGGCLLREGLVVLPLLLAAIEIESRLRP